MTFDEIVNAVRSKFQQEIAEVESLFTLYDNQDSDDQPDNEIWCRWSVRLGQSFQAEIGVSGRTRTPSVAIAQLFAPVGAGDGEQMELADKISDAFKHVTTEDVRYQTPSVATIGRRENWWQVNVTCPFYADDQ